jgi:hypothetical protein
MRTSYEIKNSLGKFFNQFTMEKHLETHPYVSSRSILDKKKSGGAEKIFAEYLSNFLDSNN